MASRPLLSHTIVSHTIVSCTIVLTLATAAVARRFSPAPPAPPHGPANVLLLTVDTLRVDRLSGYGHWRTTSPNIDRLLKKGVRFTQARTVEPLTNPSTLSMLTSLYPHEHGATRNGLRARPGLVSLPKALHARGYQTAAIVGNWTLKDKLSGLGEHFERFEGVFTRKRWFGLLKSETTAQDLTDEAIGWLHRRHETGESRPFFLWVHYVEPHAPYRFQETVAAGLGLGARGRRSVLDRYDTEVAFVDHHMGRLLDTVDESGLGRNTLVVFLADHGESLGEHGYWGHGRNLYEPTLHIPMALYWPGTLSPQTIGAPAVNLDIPPTVLRLLDQPLPGGFRGFDWSAVLHGGSPPADRITLYQAHKGAVLSNRGGEMARRSGLLEVGLIRHDRKEVFRIEGGARSLFDLDRDLAERKSLSTPKASPSPDLLAWMRTVYAGLTSFDDQPPEPLDAESAEQLRSLGYVD